MPDAADTAQMTLTDFLLARICDDESVARAAQGHVIEGTFAAVSAAHMLRHGPARVLAECEAKRQIVKRWQSVSDYIKVRHAERMPADAIQRDARVMYESLRDLAFPFADHPDYREEWKP